MGERKGTWENELEYKNGHIMMCNDCTMLSDLLDTDKNGNNKYILNVIKICFICDRKYF